MTEFATTRRAFVTGACVLPLSSRFGWTQGAVPKMTVRKDPNCGCCGQWIAYLRTDGFVIEPIDTADLDRVKAQLGVPTQLASCHTAEIGGYVIEGHVPHTAIRRLLTEKPQAIGIAVPGMPQSAPGMDVPGARDRYDVILFGRSGSRVYARFEGRTELPI